MDPNKSDKSHYTYRHFDSHPQKGDPYTSTFSTTGAAPRICRTRS
jgi:hypothetical protein